MSDLHDELTELHGVGDSTAGDIMDILAEHGPKGERDPLLQKAIDAAHEGDDRDAAMYLRRYDRAE